MKNISLTNFKVFKDKQAFDFAPITLLTGKNNSGKSSVLKALLILEDYLKSDNHLIIKLDGPNYFKHKINTLENLYTWDTNKKGFTLCFTSNSNHSFQFEFIGEPSENFAYLKGFSWAQDNNFLKIEPLKDGSFNLNISKGFFSKIYTIHKSMELQNESIANSIDSLLESIKSIDARLSSLNPTNAEYLSLLSIKQADTTKLKLQKGRLKRLSIGLSFPDQDISEHIIFGEDMPTDIGQIIQLLRFSLRFLYDKGKLEQDENYRMLQIRYQSILNDAFNINVFHLSANRNIQERIFVSGQNNQEIFNLINAFQKSQNIKGSQARVFTEKWLRAFDLGTDVKTKPYEGGVAKAVEVKRAGQWRNIADLGFGAGQLLTIILKVAALLEPPRNHQIIFSRRFRDNILLIEEPEANLHPNFQSKLAEMFLDAIDRSKIYDNRLTIILESHSEYLIRNIQVKVKELSMGHPFKIYFMGSEKGTYEMRFREDGKFLDEFGSGFFDESRKLAFEII